MVTAGGVPVREVDRDTMESRKVGGLYLVGEMLDLTGPSGGYNLQLSWSTGWVAGEFGGGKRCWTTPSASGGRSPPDSSDRRRSGQEAKQGGAVADLNPRLPHRPPRRRYSSHFSARAWCICLPISSSMRGMWSSTVLNIPLAKSRPCWSGR